MRLEAERKIARFPCPSCGAGNGEACRSKSDQPTRAHKARVALAETGELRAAAIAIRSALADVYTGPPWGVCDKVGIVASGDPDHYGDWVSDSAWEGDASWIALMSPALGEPLADWLEAEAARLDQAARPEWHEAAAPRAFAVARAINKTAELAAVSSRRADT